MSQGQLFSAKPSGVDIRQLTHLTDGHSATFPRVSVGGRRVVYLSDESGDQQVWVMRLDGTHPHQVSHDPDYTAVSPTWSPTGRIAFSRCSHVLGTCRIATMNAKGGDIHELTHGYWHDGTAAFGDGNLVYSPDGTFIAFGSDRGGYDTRLWVVRSDGTGLRLLVAAPHGESRPVDWSPDGNRILGLASPGPCCIAFTIHPDGSAFHVVQHTVFPEAYSPDGTRILTHGVANGDITALSIMNADGSDIHTIEGLPADAGYFTGVAWAPAPASPVTMKGGQR